MSRILVLLLCFVVILAACAPDSGDLTPTSPNATQSATATHTPRPTSTTIAVQTKTATPSPTFAFAPSPTQETVDEGELFRFYRVRLTVNVREDLEPSSAVLYQLQPGTIVIAYDVDIVIGGIRRAWILNNCAETLPATGYAAISSVSTVWLELAPDIGLANC